MKHLKSISITYIVASMFIGPGVILYALGRGRYGMDCSDQTWSAISESAKLAYYNDAALIMTVVSASMLIIGAILVYLLVRRRARYATIAAILTVIMMTGYGFIIASANTWNCTG